MKTMIEEKLSLIEKRHNITIHYAAESGSRAWGFPSSDSDFDVRFIYTRKLDDYLRVEPVEDQLIFPINHNLDISGWDLQKTLRLFIIIWV